jgi:hypothetical protein
MKGDKVEKKSPVTHSALNPSGIQTTLDRHPLAPRLPSLDGKVVYFVESFARPVFMQELAERLKRYAPGVKTVYVKKTTGFHSDEPELWDKVAREADAMVHGTVMGFASGAHGAGWTVGLEKRGIPTVYLVCNPFGDYIRYSAKSFGMPTLRCLLYDLVYEDRIKTDATDAWFNGILSDVVNALTGPLTEEEKKAGKIVPKKESRIAMTGTCEEIQDYFYEQGWTDGLPIVPPTEEKVKEMLKGTSHDPGEIVDAKFKLEITANKISVEKVAVNGVMAGCKPEYMPVLLALAEALGTGDFDGMGSPTAQSFMTLVNGPIRKEIGMNRGLNTLGPGNRANASIGRFVRLATINLIGLKPGYNDMSAIGNPLKYCFCYAENEEESPWKPFHVSRGFKPKDSVVSVFNGGLSYGNVMAFGTREEILKSITNVRSGSTFLMTPDTASLYAEIGMSKEDMEQYIFEHAADLLSVRKKTMFTFLPPGHEKMSDDTLVPVYHNREDIRIIVAGGKCAQPCAQSWQYSMPAMVSVDKWR